MNMNISRLPVLRIYRARPHVGDCSANTIRALLIPSVVFADGRKTSKRLRRYVSAETDVSKILKQTYSQSRAKAASPRLYCLPVCVRKGGLDGWWWWWGGLITVLVLKVKERQEAQIQFKLLHV